MSPEVTVIIPTYNEAPCIETLLRRVLAVPVDKEIIVVNDGSTDGTGQILARLQDELPFRLLTQKRNYGKGCALRSGLAISRGDIILFQDADLEYSPEEYRMLLEPLRGGGASIVYGSRFLGAQRAPCSWHRFGNWIITALINRCFHVSLTDVETGHKAFRRQVIDSLSLQALRFEVEVEVTCKALRQGLMIWEVPISYQRRGYAEGKKVTWKDGVHAIWVIVQCWLEYRFLKSSRESYCLVSEMKAAS